MDVNTDQQVIESNVHVSCTMNEMKLLLPLTQDKYIYIYIYRL